MGQEEELAQVKLKLASAKAGYEASRRPKNVTRTRNPSGANGTRASHKENFNSQLLAINFKIFYFSIVQDVLI